jgi:radical SAM-linked protein
MTRAVRRAGIPLWYTEGFHPHPYLTFPLPLPLGQESLREPMDLRIETDLPDGEILTRLAAALPEGLAALEVTAPVLGPGDIAAADYRIYIPFPAPEEAAAWTARAGERLAAGGLTAAKIGKQGHRKVEKEISLSALLSAYRLAAEGSAARLTVRLAAGSEQNCNPALLLEALDAPCGAEICRTGLLDKTGAPWR